MLVAPKDEPGPSPSVPASLSWLLGNGRLAMADLGPSRRASTAGPRWSRSGLGRRWRPGSPRPRTSGGPPLVSRGEAPLGIVYRTDAAADRTSRWSARSRRRPPADRLSGRPDADSTHPDAGAFLTYLRSAGPGRLREAGLQRPQQARFRFVRPVLQSCGAISSDRRSTSAAMARSVAACMWR